MGEPYTDEDLRYRQGVEVGRRAAAAEIDAIVCDSMRPDDTEERTKTLQEIRETVRRVGRLDELPPWATLTEVDGRCRLQVDHFARDTRIVIDTKGSLEGMRKIVSTLEEWACEVADA